MPASYRLRLYENYRFVLYAQFYAAHALGAEAVGSRFFRSFQRTLDTMTLALPRACPAADRHALALLQLTRVLFLYFVQSKG